MRKSSWKYCYRVQGMGSIVPIAYSDSLARAVKVAERMPFKCRVLAGVNGEMVLTVNPRRPIRRLA
jgi:hypothetical protein